MLSVYERKLLVAYLANAASSLNPRERASRKLVECVLDEDNRIVFPGDQGHRFRDPWEGDDAAEKKISAKDLSSLEMSLRTKYANETVRPDRTAQRLRRFGKTAGLNRTDIDILELLLRYRTNIVFESMIGHIFGRQSTCENNPNVSGELLTLLLGLSVNTIQGRLQRDAALVRSGLLTVDDNGNISTISRLHRLVTAPGDENVDPTRLLLDVAPPGDLEWSDFDHITHDRDYVEALMRGAVTRDARGVNILLYGPPGTGKTEFGKALANRLDMTLYSGGEADERGNEPSRSERLQECTLAQHLLTNNRNALLLFDEMDDLLEGSSWNHGFTGPLSFSPSLASASTVFMHRLLERAPAPTLWTMNDARCVSPAILRRMMFALELRPPTRMVRAKIWSRHLDHHGIEAEPGEVQALAAEFEITPGIAAGATAAARLGGGDVAAVRRGVRSLSRLLSCGRLPERTPARFDPGLMRADTDLVALSSTLAATGARRFSVCLQGPPGTGKSAFVRYLADLLGLEVIQKRASDLMSMWAGATEQHIAAAFAEARDTGAFLVFDEADSLLGDRCLAQRNWEVSQVNEMLTWMETHPLPFACTTNFGEHLDLAALRRFVFKIALDYLAPEQIKAAFHVYFDLPAPASLASEASLTPGDFSVVHRKAKLLGQLREPEALAAMLRGERDSRPVRAEAIGFRA